MNNERRQKNKKNDLDKLCNKWREVNNRQANLKWLNEYQQQSSGYRRN